MTQQEFRAWFEGFTEAMDSTPNTKQWERIKARVKEIDGAAVTERVFVDRYWQYSTYPIRCGGFSAPVMPTWTCDGRAETVSIYFNSSDAMMALGKTDYLSS